MECHRCLHGEDVESGKYRAVPFETTPCASCELIENSEDTIAFDDGWKSADGEPREPANGQRGLRQGTIGSADHAEDWLPISVMSEAVAQLLAMPRGMRDIVCWRFVGMPYGDIAAAEGLTLAAVEHKHRRAMKSWPALRALFALKAEKQRRRRVSRHNRQRG